MEAYSTTTDLKSYYLREEDDDNDDEGFAEVEVESLIVPKPEVQDDLIVPKPTSKPKILYREPKLSTASPSQNSPSSERKGMSVMNSASPSYRSSSDQPMGDRWTRINEIAVGRCSWSYCLSAWPRSRGTCECRQDSCG